MEELTIGNMEKIGFKKVKKTYFCEMREENIDKEVYEIKGRVNDFIYFNPKEKVYKFYYKTVIGGKANHVHLDIRGIPQLIMILQVFQIENTFWVASPKK